MTIAVELVDAPHAFGRRLGRTSLEGGLTWFLKGTDGAPANATALTYTLDWAFQAPVDKQGKAVLAMEAGERLSADRVLKPLLVAKIDAYYTQVASAAPDANNLVAPSASQAYYRDEYLDAQMSVELGKLDVHATFDTNIYAKKETVQFMSWVFERATSTSYPVPDRNYAPGAALSYASCEMIDISLVTASGNSAVFAYPTLGMQLTFKPVFAGRGGNDRFYAIAHSRNNANTQIDGNGAATSSAWGLSSDQAIATMSACSHAIPCKTTTSPSTSSKALWSVDASLQDALCGREADAAGIGYGSVILNHKVNPAARLGFTHTGDESHGEVYYNLGVSDYLTLTADLQLLTCPGGLAAVNTVAVAGFRGPINF